MAKKIIRPAIAALACGQYVRAGKKARARVARVSSYKVAERTGLEPATPGVTGRYSNQLNYRSALKRKVKGLYGQPPYQ